MLTIVSDVHLAAKRQGGTTPASQEALRIYLQDQFRQIVGQTTGHLLIAGDLFDDFTVDARDLLGCHDSLSGFLEGGGQLTLMAGNHDYSPRGDKVSSFHLLSTFLERQFEHQVDVIDSGLAEVETGVWAIPHMPNQELFDLELDRALALAPLYLILHANYNNEFAAKSDHSLNVSQEVARKFAELDVTLMFAHEHQHGSDLGGMVTLMGNQMPSSVADCLGNHAKYYHRLSSTSETLERVESWSRAGVKGYSEIGWRDLDPEAEFGEGFIRVVGAARAEEAEAVIDAIAKYRAKSTAFVVSNAVQIEGLAEMSVLGEINAEAMNTFDVWNSLMAEMTEPEQNVLKELMA